MKTRDITLSSSLIGIYIAIIVIGAATPLKVGAIMYSALFGIFWPYAFYRYFKMKKVFDRLPEY